MRLLPLVVAPLIAAAAIAHAQTAQQYLVFPTYAEAQARSAQECQTRGCDGVHTVYWWGVMPNRNDGSGAVVIAAAPFDQTDLTPAEQAALITEAQATAAGFPTPTWQASQSAP